MRGLENETYLYMLIAFNILAIFYLCCAVWWPRIARLLFCLLFAWACWLNWTTSQNTPNDYLQYADNNFSAWYSNFIRGWFSKHIPLLVGIIATCQGLIAISMLLKGWLYKTACIGAITFMVAIAPFGVGSGFPCTIIFAVALAILYRKGTHYLWELPQKKVLN